MSSRIFVASCCFGPPSGHTLSVDCFALPCSGSFRKLNAWMALALLRKAAWVRTIWHRCNTTTELYQDPSWRDEFAMSCTHCRVALLWSVSTLPLSFIFQCIKVAFSHTDTHPGRASTTAAAVRGIVHLMGHSRCHYKGCTLHLRLCLFCSLSLLLACTECCTEPVCRCSDSQCVRGPSYAYRFCALGSSTCAHCSCCAARCSSRTSTIVLQVSPLLS
jgi:hypothetical protein